MKTKILLSTAVALFFAGSVAAQTDITPENWKFSKKAVGTNISDIFIKEAARNGGNIAYSGDPGGKGFRRGDNLAGSIAVNDWTGAEADYPDMTEADKKKFEDFYASWRIVNGGILGNILCYQGATSTAVDSRAVKNPTVMGGPALNILTQELTVKGVYRISFSLRVIMNEGAATATMNMYAASSWYDQQMYAGSDKGILFTMDCAPAFNAYWTTYQYEIEAGAKMDEAGYNLTPFVNKLGMGAFANNSIILMRDLKLEMVPAPTLSGDVKVIDEDWSDTPTGNQKITEDNVIVYANGNEITVIDAKAPIQVYSISGQLIEQQAANAKSFNTITIGNKGTYIVKVGTSSNKVVIY